MTLRESREKTVLAHVAAENNHDVQGTLNSFHDPGYTVVPFGPGGTVRGAEGVGALLGGLFAGFPDFRAEIQALHHTDSAVVAEVLMTGTHQGPWAGLPATGKPIHVPTCCIFEFDGDKLMNEKVYFDNATMMAQLGA
ncbi:MAG: ester cyclase [Acidobacteria bacterium]|nr:ester cyclase [Acidobacteriota bacterium]